MKDYMKPELEYVLLATEAVTADEFGGDGSTDAVSDIFGNN